MLRCERDGEFRVYHWVTLGGHNVTYQLQVAAPEFELKAEQTICEQVSSPGLRCGLVHAGIVELIGTGHRARVRAVCAFDAWEIAKGCTQLI